MPWVTDPKPKKHVCSFPHFGRENGRIWQCPVCTRQYCCAQIDIPMDGPHWTYTLVTTNMVME